MIRTRQLKLIDGAPKWVYGWESRDYRKGDKITFLCNGRGRGGHYSVAAVVDKVNPKTLKATEAERSYRPRTTWTLHRESDSQIYVELPAEVSQCN